GFSGRARHGRHGARAEVDAADGVTERVRHVELVAVASDAERGGEARGVADSVGKAVLSGSAGEGGRGAGGKRHLADNAVERVRDVEVPGAVPYQGEGPVEAGVQSDVVRVAGAAGGSRQDAQGGPRRWSRRRGSGGRRIGGQRGRAASGPEKKKGNGCTEVQGCPGHARF